jgi:AraC family transcriptional regulator, transcriptional activator FtrA
MPPNTPNRAANRNVMGRSSRQSVRTPGLLAIVAYDGLRTFEYSIAAEVFALARPSLGVPWYESVVVSPERGKLRGIAGVAITPDAAFSRIREANTVIIPGWRDVDERPPAALLDAVHAAVKRNARVLSICSGAFVLAEAGVLDGKRATTHWLFADTFRTRFPKVQFEEDVLYIDEGNIITSAGSAAGMDACLHLVRRDFGAKVANTVAKRMVVAPHREGGQAQYVEAPVAIDKARAERGLGRVMDWARKNLHDAITVDALAERSAMSVRSFHRHFVKAVGLPPTNWLTRERIARARELLEATRLSHDEIAGQCGYESMESFRVAFKRVAGIPPGAYRERFART